MKTIIASITRLILSYSKFGLMVFSLSLINTALKSDDSLYYLNSGSQFLKISGVYIQERKNIRQRKLINKFIQNSSIFDQRMYKKDIIMNNYRVSK